MQATRAANFRPCLPLTACLLVLAGSGSALAQEANAAATAGGGIGATTTAAAPAGATTAAPEASATAAPAASTAATPETAPKANDETADEPAAEAAYDPTPVGDEAVVETRSDLPWALANRRYNTLAGPTGGIHLVDPSTGAPGSVRIQLGMSLMDIRDFLFEGDEVQQTGQSLTVGWTITKYIELWGALQNSGTAYNEPRTLYTLGDMSLGLKSQFQVAEVVSLGADLRIKFLPDAGSMETAFGGTGVGIRGAFGLDLQRLPNPVPFVARLNLDYYFDNSAELVVDTERDHYDSLEEPQATDDENRNLVTRFERFGLGVNRVDMFTWGVGVEAPLEVGPEVYLHPMAEFVMGIPANRQGYDCPFYSSDDTRGTTKGPDDTCLDEVGSDAWPMVLTLGTRFIPPVRGLSSFLAVDIGLSGTDTFVRELAPTAPVRVHFGLGYDFDARPIPERIVEVPVEAAAPPAPPRGRVAGLVVDSATGAGIPAAQVRFSDPALSALSTDADGRYTGYAMAPGPVPVSVIHPDYAEGQCGTVIPEGGGDVELRCELQRSPAPGALTAQLTDAYGAALAGVRVSLTGPSSESGLTDAAGRVSFNALTAGNYSLKPTTETHLLRAVNVTVEARGRHSVTVPLTTRPATAAVGVRGETIRVRGVAFKGDSAEPTAASVPALAELADLLLRSNEIARIQVQAPGPDGLALTRGLRIKQRLVDLGVAAARVEALSGGGRQLKVSIAN